MNELTAGEGVFFDHLGGVVGLFGLAEAGDAQVLFSVNIGTG